MPASHTDSARRPKLDHNGPPSWPRVKIQKSQTVSSLQKLRTGASLSEELLRITSSLGVSAAYAELFSGILSPVDYCVPAEGGPQQCVAFSEDRASGTGHLIQGSATIGTRAGRPFVHSHLCWTDERGRQLAGHVWPSTMVGFPPPAAAVFGLLDVEWMSFDDPETSMPTFEPSTSQTKESLMAHQDTSAAVARVLPNEDLTEAALTLCQESDYSQAVVRAGLGSLIGACFTDLRTGEVVRVDGPGTEVISVTGFVKTGSDKREAWLTCTLVDKHGTVHSGLLVPGQNPVAVTFELTVQPIRDRTSSRQ